MKKGKKSIVTVILAFILAVAGGVIYDNESEAPKEEAVQLEVLQEETEVVQEQENEQEDSSETTYVYEESSEVIVENVEETPNREEDYVVEEEELTFRKEYNLTSHYEKHGVEMGFDSAQEYLDAANAVVNNPDSLHKLESEDGDDVYYLEATNEFVVVSKDGYIRTYFCPSDGLDYFNRQ